MSNRNFDDQDFCNIANRIPRRVWGIRVIATANPDPDYWNHRTLRNRLYDRFEPIIMIVTLTAMSATALAIAVLVATQ